MSEHKGHCHQGQQGYREQQQASKWAIQSQLKAQQSDGSLRTTCRALASSEGSLGPPPLGPDTTGVPLQPKGKCRIFPEVYGQQAGSSGMPE